jgi:hypothetical protein
VISTRLPAAGRARQQRPDLRRGRRVVQHHQHPPVGQLGPPQPGPLLHRVRYPVTGHADRAQQHVQRGGRVGGRRAGGVPVQVDEELPVRVAVGQPVRHVHRQGGLADAGHAVDGGDHHGPAGRVRAGQRRQQALHLALAAGEVGDVAGQVAAPPRPRRPAGRRRRPPRCRGRRGGRLAGQQPLVRGAQLRRRVGAQLVPEPAAQLLVGGERVGLPAARLQRGDQPVPQRLPQRVPGGPGAQLDGDVRGPAGGQVQAGAPLDGGQPLLHQVGHLVAVQRLGAQPLQRLAAPQPQRLVEQLACLLRLDGLGGLRQQLPEPHQVNVVAGQPVSGGGGVDRAVAEQLAQPGHVGREAGADPGRQRLAPDPLGERVHADRPARRHGQHREHDRLAAGRYGHGHAVEPGLQRTQDAHPEPDIAHPSIKPDNDHRISGDRRRSDNGVTTG